MKLEPETYESIAPAELRQVQTHNSCSCYHSLYNSQCHERVPRQSAENNGRDATLLNTRRLHHSQTGDADNADRKLERHHTLQEYQPQSAAALIEQAKSWGIANQQRAASRPSSR